MNEATSIVIADVDVLTVECVSDLLERHGFHVRIAPPTFDAVRDWVHHYGAEICIIDIALRDGIDFPALERLCESAATKVIVRTADSSYSTMDAALEAGVCGYIHKSRGPVVFLDAIRDVAGGEIVVEGTFARADSATSTAGEELELRFGALTPRQMQCLELLAEGTSTISMAKQMGVSVMTVRSHIQAVLEKLGVRSRVEAVSVMSKHQSAAAS